MRLNDELRLILGRTPCELHQFTCSDCQSLCTWARIEGKAVAVGGCVCNFTAVNARMQAAREGWEKYPPESSK